MKQHILTTRYFIELGPWAKVVDRTGVATAAPDLDNTVQNPIAPAIDATVVDGRCG
ncbi:hypothetical protein [Rhodococcoides yunnanense]|uniref:Uncharacterized protein n=1 Tax=Rhodococcoides yunnanense TaxID=278209 RepID=A0ABU4B8S6_9NOCA|nr:hypothetical protein [Rhodococcus yunnanensis]MDV6260598.1 hypothetical protein [Rhodococcus yunnanensis]